MVRLHVRQQRQRHHASDSETCKRQNSHAQVCVCWKVEQHRRRQLPRETGFAISNLWHEGQDWDAAVKLWAQCQQVSLKELGKESLEGVWGTFSRKSSGKALREGRKCRAILKRLHVNKFGSTLHLSHLQDELENREVGPKRRVPTQTR